MERYIIFYLLSLKNHMKKRETYFAVLGMVFLLWVISGISVPNAKTMKAGIICGNSSVACQIKENLDIEKEGFEFVEYENEEKLTIDVINGKVDCGFVFSMDFDRMYEERNTDDGILYLSTAVSSKGEVLKEKVYAAFLCLYSDQILIDAEEKVFGDYNTTREEKLAKQNKIYQNGTDIFQIKIEEIAGNNLNENIDVLCDTISGVIGLSIFIIMFLSYGVSQVDGSDHVEKALIRKERYMYRLINMLTAAILPMVTGVIWKIGMYKNLNIFMEILCLFFFVIVSAVWLSIVCRAIKKVEYLPIWLLSMIVLHILICPIVYDFSIYVSVIKYFRYLLPLNILL